MNIPKQYSSIWLQSGCVHTHGDIRVLNTPEYEIAWLGFVYMDGVACGESSIRKFVAEIGADLAAVASKLKGVYFVAIRDRVKARTFAFVDCSAVYHAYVSAKLIGTSFLEVVSREQLRPDDLDPEAVVEFLHFGNIYSGNTLFSQIRKIEADEIVESRVDGSIATYKKSIPDLSRRSHRSFEEILCSFARSVANEKVSVDLTGGIDSRLLAVALDYAGLKFEVALSGYREQEDVPIAEEVAKLLGRDFVLTPHSPQQTDWDDLFAINDGLFDLAKSDRSVQLQRDRVQRGITLAVSGAGGELYKDFWWLQDFPFYARRRPNLERLYDIRFFPGRLEYRIFGPRYQASAASLRKRMIESWLPYRAGTNTETYDRIYYGEKMREFAGRFLTNSSKILCVNAPYIDREMVSIGYNLARSKRFFNGFHRALITKYSPRIAATRTTEGGISASASPIYVSGDLIKYVNNRLLRLKTKLYQRRGLPVRAHKGPDSPQLGSVLDEFASARKTIQRLQDYGILGKTASIAQTKMPSMGSLISLDMFIERLESGSTTRTSAKSSIHAA
jgi:hypothetical protein